MGVEGRQPSSSPSSPPTTLPPFQPQHDPEPPAEDHHENTCKDVDTYSGNMSTIGLKKPAAWVDRRAYRAHYSERAAHVSDFPMTRGTSPSLQRFTTSRSSASTFSFGASTICPTMRSPSALRDRHPHFNMLLNKMRHIDDRSTLHSEENSGALLNVLLDDARHIDPAQAHPPPVDAKPTACTCEEAARGTSRFPLSNRCNCSLISVNRSFNDRPAPMAVDAVLLRLFFNCRNGKSIYNNRSIIDRLHRNRSWPRETVGRLYSSSWARQVAT